MPRLQFSREYFALLLVEDSCHYLFFSTIFLYVSPFFLILLPVVLFAILHAASYSLTLLDVSGHFFDKTCCSFFSFFSISSLTTVWKKNRKKKFENCWRKRKKKFEGKKRKKMFEWKKSLLIPKITKLRIYSNSVKIHGGVLVLWFHLLNSKRQISCDWPPCPRFCWCHWLSFSFSCKYYPSTSDWNWIYLWHFHKWTNFTIAFSQSAAVVPV